MLHVKTVRVLPNRNISLPHELIKLCDYLAGILSAVSPIKGLRWLPIVPSIGYTDDVIFISPLGKLFMGYNLLSESPNICNERLRLDVIKKKSRRSLNHYAFSPSLFSSSSSLRKRSEISPL